MLNLNARLSIRDIEKVQEYTRLRLKNPERFKMAESLALYEQRYMEPSEVLTLCEEAEGMKLYEPPINHVPEEIVSMFRYSDLVPVSYLHQDRRVTCVWLPEIGGTVSSEVYKIDKLPTTLPYYLSQYQYHYGSHVMLQEVPVAVVFRNIVQEAINLGAADITISTLGMSSRVYYNVRKKIVESRRVFDASYIRDMITFLCVKSPYEWGTRTPKYVDFDLTREYRGRVVINSKYKGFSITIRLLPNTLFGESISTLSMTEGTKQWLLQNILDVEPGLRLIVGETMSGKNTTALALLSELTARGKYKIISVEMPVEQTLIGVEQINTETVQEYSENIKSLIHQNPDFVYITEIRDVTGLDTLQITNTGKRVLSTLHANSVADTISRLADITGLGLDRIVQSLHSVVYQKLLRDEETDTVFPRDRYVRFDYALKSELYGKSLGEMIRIVREREGGDLELK